MKSTIKKNIKIMLALLAGAITLASCSENSLFEETAKQAKDAIVGNMTFTACMSGNDDDATTRTALGSNGASVLWSDGDAISVFSLGDSKNTRIALASGAGTNSGSFNGICTKGTEYYAVYPYIAESSYYDKGCIIEWNGIEQTAEKGSFDSSIPMMAKATGVSEEASTVPLNFKHVFSFVKVTTDFSCKSITLTSKNSNDVLSTASVYTLFDNEGNPYIQAKDPEKSNYVTLKGKDGACIEAGTYYIAVLPGTLAEGFDLSFYEIHGQQTLTKSTTKSVELKRSKVLNLGTLQVSDLTTDEIPFLGHGTESSPYLITSYDDWVKLSAKLRAEGCDSYNTKYYSMVNDIDCEGKEALEPIKGFKGHFNGNNHTLKNYRMKTIITYVGNNKSEYENSLFSIVIGADIQSLNAVFDGFETTEYVVYDCPGFALSPFIGKAQASSISNCHLTGTRDISCELRLRQLDGTYGVGGLIGISYEWLVIRDCSNAVNLDIHAGVYEGSPGSYTMNAGGIVGYAMADDNVVKIDRCRNTGDLIVHGKNYMNAGGIVGLVKDRTDGDVELYVTNCVNKGRITAGYLDEASTWRDDAIAGGIVGKLDSDGENVVPHVYNCLNKGRIQASQTDESWVGGIVGWAYSPTLAYDDPHLFNCVNSGTMYIPDHSDCYKHPFVGNTDHGYNSKYTKCCKTTVSSDNIISPSYGASEMNENIGSSKLPSGWVGYSFGCCSWVEEFDLDFNTKVK